MAPLPDFAKPTGFAVTANTTSGLRSGDSVTVNYTGAVYNNANVPNANKITVSGMSLSGANANDYVLSATSRDVTATITKANATNTATITGTAAVGQTLTANTETNSDGEVTLSQVDEHTLNLEVLYISCTQGCMYVELKEFINRRG